MLKKVILCSILLITSSVPFTNAQAIQTEPEKVIVTPTSDAVTVIPKTCRTFTHTGSSYAVGALTTILTNGYNIYFQLAAGFSTSFVMNQLPSTYVCTWQYRAYHNDDNRWHLYQTIVSYKYSNYTTPLRTQTYRIGYY